ncbi:MAG TPA: hypothetical protein PKD73_12470 [Burkholderiaceae bacterium]|nr:hypothetical protein [Burkholderiaceae bacterium]
MWLVKCAPRTCWAAPSSPPASSATASQCVASLGEASRSQNQPAMKAKPEVACPAGKHCPPPGSRNCQSQWEM